tara:strand:- start:328 stop:954 length:627 start_codon:yes stop_codon:yes gene_type:complete
MKDVPQVLQNDHFESSDWWKDLNEMLLTKCNMEFLGHGYFSAAFTHPEDKTKVVKIGFKIEDSGAAYAAFCRQNQGLYGIPTVYHLERLDKAYIVVLDKLVDYRHAHEDTEGEYDAIQAVIRNGNLGSDLYRKLSPNHPIYEAAFRIRHFFEGVARFDLHNENIMIKELETGGQQLVITDPVSYTNNKQEMIEKENELGFSRKQTVKT